jgi:hypothetical protein
MIHTSEKHHHSQRLGPRLLEQNVGEQSECDVCSGEDLKCDVVFIACELEIGLHDSDFRIACFVRLDYRSVGQRPTYRFVLKRRHRGNYIDVAPVDERHEEEEPQHWDQCEVVELAQDALFDPFG